MLSDKIYKNNKINKFTNWIIKKLNITAIVIKNDEVDSLDSDRVNKTDKILVKSKNIKNLSKAKNL